MQARAEDAGLYADLVGHRDDAALGHRGPEPAPLEHGDLHASDDDDRVVDEDERGENEEAEHGEAEIAGETERGEET